MPQAIISDGDEYSVDAPPGQFRKHNLFIAQDRYSAYRLTFASGIQAGHDLVPTTAEQVDDDLGMATGPDHRDPVHDASPGAALTGNALPSRHSSTLELTWSRSCEKSASGTQAPVRSSMRYSA